MIIDVLAIEKKIQPYQDGLYGHLRNYPKTHAVMGRLGVIPVAIIDAAIELLIEPINLITHVACAAINLMGFLFSRRFSLEDAALSIISAAVAIPLFVVKGICVPFFLAHQIVVGLQSPETLLSMHADTYGTRGLRAKAT